MKSSEIAMRYDTDFMNQVKDGVNMETREDYMEWVAFWKKAYANLSDDIKIVKNMRKPYIYDYRDASDTKSQRRTNAVENPDYDDSADFWLFGRLKNTANTMLHQRKLAKSVAAKRSDEYFKTAA